MWRKKLYSTYLIFFCSYISQIKEESGFRYFIFRLTGLLRSKHYLKISGMVTLKLCTVLVEMQQRVYPHH